MTKEEESALIARVLAGDADAFEPLVLEHQTNVYRLALRLMGNEADAADAAQDAFLKAYTSLSSFRGDSRFSVWLYRLTNNVCIDALRRRRDTVPLETEDAQGEAEELPLPDERWSPEILAERAEDIRAVRTAMAALPPDCREILTLREIGGLSYEELSAALRLELGTVRSRLSRARKKLADELMKSGNYTPAPHVKQQEGGARR
jgi:RNA polymerase sigma-70 factor (ECF subfamily)